MMTGGIDPSLSPEAVLKARSDIRTSCVAVLAASIAGLSFFLGIRTFHLSRTGQQTERFRQSVEALNSGALPVRLGAVYSLEQLASSSSFDRESIRQVLAAFVRTSKPLEPSGETCITPDAQAAIRVLGSGWSKKGGYFNNLDFKDAILIDAKLSKLSFRNADFSGADLTGADLSSSDLRGTVFDRSILMSAVFSKSKHSDATFDGADTRGAIGIKGAHTTA